MKRNITILLLLIFLVATLLMGCTLPIHTHDFGEWAITKAPTCTEDGLMETEACSCGLKKTSVIPAIGHVPGSWIVDSQLSCTTDCVKHQICETCGQIISTETIPATGHSFGEWTIVKQPTCTEDGQEERVCSCGERQTKIIPALNHDYSDWTIVEQASCTKEGLEERSCHCGYKEERVLDKLAHAFTEETIPPTCITEGYTTHTCAVCKYKYIDTITPPVNHDEVIHSAQAPTCTQDGWNQYVTCKNCTYTTFEALPATGHTEGEWIVDKQPSCTQPGSQHQLCAVCLQAINTQEIAATGIHNFIASSNCLYCDGDIAKIATSIYDMSSTDGNVHGYVVARGNDAFDLYIKGSGDIKDYKYQSAFVERDSIVNIYIQEGITSIGKYSLDGCSKVCAITIPQSVQVIKTSAFTGCEDLTDIVIEGCPEVEEGAFNYTGYYDNQDNWIDGALYVDNILVKVQEEIRTCIIRDGTRSIANNAFLGSDSLSSVVIADSVVSIGQSAFAFCQHIESVIISEYSQLATIEHNAFTNCSNLKSIFLPSGLVSIQDFAFYECTNLSSITFGEQSRLISIGDFSFNKCSSIENIVIPSSVTTIGESAFSNCTSLKNITIPAGIESLQESAFFDCQSLQSATFENGIILNEIAANCFMSCDSLASIEIPYGVTTICDSAFFGCSSLQQVILPNSVVTIEDKAFSYCEKLSSITFEKDSRLQSIGSRAFISCESLEEIVLPATLSNIGEWAFFQCGSIACIQVDSDNTHYKSVEGTLYTKDGTRLIKYASSSTETSFNVPSGVLTISPGAFYNASSLINVNVASSVTNIGYQAFYGCNSLQSITLLSDACWYVSKDQGATSGTSVSTIDSYKNAQLLTQDYSYYYWLANLEGHTLTEETTPLTCITEG